MEGNCNRPFLLDTAGVFLQLFLDDVIPKWVRAEDTHNFLDPLMTLPWMQASWFLPFQTIK